MTIYSADSYYSVMHNAHQVYVKRADMRSRGLEMLKWEWVSYEPGMIPDDSTTLMLDDHEVKAFFQAFLDRAWQLGLRPAHYETESNEMKATKAHLEDMRTLVFKP